MGPAEFCSDGARVLSRGATMAESFFETVQKVLMQDSRFFAEDGSLLRNAVYEAAMQSDEDLISLLLDNPITRSRFFKRVGDVMVFDKVEFGWTVNNRAFLPDSYTRFKNKIGLADESGRIIAQSGDVELVFPYKDCVLEGGQTKDDQTRQEVFYNETLAPDEVDRLLAPKVFTGARRYTANGIEEAVSFREDDNLLIRGNNLLSLASLVSRFEGAVKCIYLDPPYNTGNDEFGYNDSFNHSTWLLFMKNRLELAKKLLRRDGAIFLQVDHHELGYLIVLMDEIFGIENKVQVIAVKTASPAGFKTVNPGPIDVTEYILFYTKSKPDFQFRKAYVPVGYNKNYNLVLDDSGDIKSWTFRRIKDVVIEDAGFANESEARRQYGSSWKTILGHLIADYAFNHAENVVSIRDPHKPTESLRRLLAASRQVDHPLEYKHEDGSSSYVYRGGVLAFYSNKMQVIDGQKTVTELLSDFWNHISWAGIAREGGVKLKNGKKPEKLIKQILELATDPGDLVLDYHLGSGTTCAVACKMGRRFIGCEQLDYGENDALVRLTNVVNGDSTGISGAVGWQGGGSFIYCELDRLNQLFVDEIQDASSTDQLLGIYERMRYSGYISVRLNPQVFEENVTEFEHLSFDSQKQFLMELLDKNLLYVNYSDMEDEEFEVSDDDKVFTRSFYEGA